MPILPTSGGSSLTAIQLETLEKFAYNPNNDRLEGEVAIATTLNTFWLSDQWGISSGGASLFFSSTDQDIDFEPIVQGIRDQSNPANQDSTGIVSPYSRVYGDNLLTTSLRGTEGASGAVPYAGISVLTSNIAVFSVKATLAEDLDLGDKLTYSIYKGTDNTGPLVFRQSLTTTDNRSDGFTFTAWWAKPAVEFAGVSVYAEIVVEPVSDPTNTRILLVRPTAEDANAHWNELGVRTFEDEPVVLENNVKPRLVSASETINKSGQLAVDTTGGAVTLTVGDVEFFEVFDATENFSISNPCTVAFGGSQGNAVLRTRNDAFKFYHDGTQWRYLDLNTKGGGVV